MKEKTKELFITYLGRKGVPDKFYHAYLLENGETIAFSTKLQKHHEIGDTYKAVQVNGNSYRTQRTDFALKAPYKIDKKMIAEAVRFDVILSNQIKARNEKKKLEKLARDAGQKIKLVYGRANPIGQLAMLRAFVEELES